MRDLMPWLVLVVIVGVFLFSRFYGKASSEDAHRLVAEGARLVDVRSPAEFASGHIDGAVNIPVDEIARRSGEIGPKDQPVVVYCQSGGRSASAASTLKGQGFTRIEDLGAMSRW